MLVLYSFCFKCCICSFKAICIHLPSFDLHLLVSGLDSWGFSCLVPEQDKLQAVASEIRDQYKVPVKAFALDVPWLQFCRLIPTFGFDMLWSWFDPLLFFDVAYVRKGRLVLVHGAVVHAHPLTLGHDWS